MKRYLSFGGGVNSTALMLLLLDQGVDFEAVYRPFDEVAMDMQPDLFGERDMSPCLCEL